MQKKIEKVISKVLGTEFNYKGKDMIEDGILDSLEMMEIISLLEVELSVEIDAEEIVPENFKTVGTIAALIEKSSPRV